MLRSRQPHTRLQVRGKSLSFVSSASIAKYPFIQLRSSHRPAIRAAVQVAALAEVVVEAGVVEVLVVAEQAAAGELEMTN